MSTAYTAQTAPIALFDYDKYWASCFEPAPFLPMSREEMDLLGWDSCDFILVCGDAYIDHPSFCSGIIGRTPGSARFPCRHYRATRPGHRLKHLKF